jgi:hypothetical protein
VTKSLINIYAPVARLKTLCMYCLGAFGCRTRKSTRKVLPVVKVCPVYGKGGNKHIEYEMRSVKWRVPGLTTPRVLLVGCCLTWKMDGDVLDHEKNQNDTIPTNWRLVLPKAISLVFHFSCQISEICFSPRAHLFACRRRHFGHLPRAETAQMSSTKLSLIPVGGHIIII